MPSSGRRSSSATRERTLHLLTILGTAGIGKSRLAQELASLAAEQATVLVGRCVPYGEGITFWSLREIVSQLTAAGPTGELLADGHEARPLADSLQEAIGVAEASSDREEIFWATRSLFEALARERPLVVFFEDVHWAEPTFLDLVEYLAERVQGAPILMVCIARPELLEERPGWGRGKPNASSLLLERLPDPDCEALIANLARGSRPARQRSGYSRPPMETLSSSNSSSPCSRKGVATRPSSRSPRRSRRCCRRGWIVSGRASAP